MRKLVRPILAAACVAGFASPAIADEVRVRVSYADLDLTNTEDVAVLNERLAHALRRACRTQVSDGITIVDDHCMETGLADGARVISEHRDRALAAAP